MTKILTICNCNCHKKENIYNFGDVFTNEINYWMVVSCGGELRPVVLNKNKNKIMGFVGYYSGSVSTIKPFARFVGFFGEIIPHLDQSSK